LRILFLTLPLLAAVSCGSKDEHADEYVKLVKTAKAVAETPFVDEFFPGVIEEAEQTNLAFRVAGPIRKIHVKEGDKVKKGQLIAELDPRDYEVQKSAIEAQVRQLQSEYERIAELNARGSVSPNDYEKMRAGKERAEASLKNAVDQLNDTKLYAPFAGYIAKVAFKDGELVNRGVPIATLIDVASLKVEVNTPPSLFIHRDKIVSISCTQDQLPGETFPLTMRSFNQKANHNGLYTLYLDHAPSENSKLAPGMNVLVKVRLAVADSSIVRIPANAVFERNGESYVWTLQDSRVVSRKVETGARLKDGYLAVIKGLKPGDEVVTGGLHLLSENEKVRIAAPASKTNIGNLL